MTTPIQPTVIRQPGIGEEMQRGLAPLLKALQLRQQQQMFQQQQAAINQRMQASLAQQAEMQRSSQMMQLFAAGLGEPGFAKSDFAKQFEQQLGITGYAASVEKAQTRAENEGIKRVDEYITSIKGLDKQTANALRAAGVGVVRGIPAGVITETFTRMAPERPLSELEQLTLKLRQVDYLSALRKYRMQPTPENEAAIAQALGAEYHPGISYSGIAEDIEKYVRRQAADKQDPSRVVINTMLRLAADTRDPLTGRARAPLSELFQTAVGIVTPFFPSVRGLQLGPEIEAQAVALQKMVTFIERIRENENRFVNPVTGETVEFKTDRQLRDFLRQDFLRSATGQVGTAEGPVRLGPFIAPFIEDLLRIALERAKPRER